MKRLIPTFSKSVIPLTILSVFISSCATMTLEECKVANWKDVGFDDGANGNTAMLADHIKSCSKSGITPNRLQYMQGYAKGEKTYCTYDNGLEAGEENKYIGSICNKAGLKAQFNEGYKKGKKRYTKKQEIQQKQNEFKKLERKVADIKSGKKKGGISALDLVYRQREIVTKEISLLEQELKNIK